MRLASKNCSAETLLQIRLLPSFQISIKCVYSHVHACTVDTVLPKRNVALATHLSLASQTFFTQHSPFQLVHSYTPKLFSREFYSQVMFSRVQLSLAKYYEQLIVVDSYKQSYEACECYQLVMRTQGARIIFSRKGLFPPVQSS